MRSDWQDRPARVRGRQRSAWWSPVVGVMAALMIAWALLVSAGKSLLIDMDALRRVVRIVDMAEPQMSPQASAYAPAENPAPLDLPAPPAATAAPAAQLGWQAPPPIRSGQQLRNEFNDSNYQARAPHNIYTAPAIQSPAPSSQPRAARAESERTAVWIKSWGGGTRYLAQWYSLDNYIDGGTVCGNHRKGSIEYRECRKGAKQYFHEQCRVWRARYLEDRSDASERMRQRYCSASSSFSPMS
jgi:hypothetical protein